MHCVSGVATLAAVSWALSLSGTTCSAAHAPKWIRLPMHPLQLQRQEWRNDSSEKIRNRRRDSRGDEPNHSSIASRFVPAVLPVRLSLRVTRASDAAADML